MLTSLQVWWRVRGWQPGTGWWSARPSAPGSWSLSPPHSPALYRPPSLTLSGWNWFLLFLNESTWKQQKGECYANSRRATMFDRSRTTAGRLKRGQRCILCDMEKLQRPLWSSAITAWLIVVLLYRPVTSRWHNHINVIIQCNNLCDNMRPDNNYSTT